MHGIIDSKRNGGQLDASNLTLNDLKKIEDTFIDIFRGLFHPRIDYARAIRPASSQRPEPATSQRSEPPRSAPAEAHRESASQPAASEGNTSAAQAGVDASSAETAASPEGGAIAAKALDDDEPIFEVPPLPKRNGSQSNSHSKLTTPSETAETPK
ncbi:MAG: hypothetical protein F4Z39_13690 [Chloroflexi bacterium]|nr:hypothetical protein [Chloroflexota bacterium]